MSLTFTKRAHVFGVYWKVFWKGRQAGMIVPTGTEGEMMLLRVTQAAYVEIGRAIGIEAAMKFYEDKVRERQDADAKAK